MMRRIVVALALGCATPAAAQTTERPAALAAARVPAPPPGTDSATAVAGPEYAAGGVHQLFFGRRWRRLWTTPVRVPVLDIGTYAGGLEPIERGGGMQTASLELQAADGREYRFRSVNKDPSAVLAEELRGTFVGRVVQDQISSAHPAGALIADPILRAAGVLHPSPQLMVMADHPALGEFREEFAGMLGLLERHADEGPDETPGFAGRRQIVGSEELLERLNADPSHRVATAEFLAARLVDMLLNDWDRHEGQWRWAAYVQAQDGDTLWRPIPEDRDQALVWYDGLLPSLARPGAPRLVAFGPEYPSLAGLTMNSSHLDRRLLASLDAPVWDSVAAQLRGRITDSVIGVAVAALPDGYRGESDTLGAALRTRRDSLPAIAARFYRQLAETVDLHATDTAEHAEIVRFDDGSVDVAIAVRGTADAGAAPYLRRRFHPGETREVRLYLHGGDDRVVVRGAAAPGPFIRIVGGNGDNQSADSADAARLGMRLYDMGQVADVTYGVDTLFDRRPWELRRGTLVAPGRDYGGTLEPALGVSVVNDLGLMVRVGAASTAYGFRRRPYARRVELQLDYATGVDRLRGRLRAEFHPESADWSSSILVLASALETVRFHGLGNETPGTPGGPFYRVGQTQYRVEPAIALPLGRSGTGTLGVFARYTSTDRDERRFIGLARPYGSADFGEIGFRAAFVHDTRDAPVAPTRGLHAAAAATLSPAVWHVDETYGRLDARAATYLQLPLAGSVLAVRAGGARVWGRYPYFAAAFIGGEETVRGWWEQRFAGDGSLYAGTDLRLHLGRPDLLVPTHVGLILLGDVGRVFREGERSTRWHTGVGGGVSLGFVDSDATVSLTVVDSEERTGVYFRGGFAF